MPRDVTLQGLEGLEPSAPRRAQKLEVAEAEQWTSVRLALQEGHAFDWAQAASLEIGAASVGFDVRPGEWAYAVFDLGQHVLGMERVDGLPVVFGDLPRAAELLGVSESLLTDYCVADPLSDVEDREDFAAEIKRLREYRGRPGDTYPVWNEFAHLDFARWLGLIYPAEGEKVTVELPDSDPSTWELPDRLSPEQNVVFRFDPAELRERILAG